MNRYALLLQRQFPLVLGLLVVTTSGCFSPEGPPTYRATGEVTFEGTPVADGQVIFEPLESDGTRPAGGPITEGQFDFQIEPGEKRVEIIAEREVGEVDPVMGARRRENYIPAKYNEQTELTAVVTENEEQNTYEFKLLK